MVTESNERTALPCDVELSREYQDLLDHSLAQPESKPNSPEPQHKQGDVTTFQDQQRDSPIPDREDHRSSSEETLTPSTPKMPYHTPFVLAPRSQEHLGHHDGEDRHHQGDEEPQQQGSHSSVHSEPVMPDERTVEDTSVPVNDDPESKEEVKLSPPPAGPRTPSISGLRFVDAPPNIPLVLLFAHVLAGLRRPVHRHNLLPPNGNDAADMGIDSASEQPDSSAMLESTLDLDKLELSDPEPQDTTARPETEPESVGLGAFCVRGPTSQNNERPPEQSAGGSRRELFLTGGVADEEKGYVWRRCRVCGG